MKKIIIASNWKMNTNITKTESLCNSIKVIMNSNNFEDVDVLIAPPFTNIYSAYSILKDTKVRVGAQNCNDNQSGAFTGEVSAEMIADVGCKFVIVGHSERRVIYNESSDTISKKLKQVLTNNLTAVYCIGETLQEKQSGLTNIVLVNQINSEMNGILPNDLKKVIIAYEPVWAIGTGLTPTLSEINQTHSFIKNHLISIYSKEALTVPVLYGGSFNEKNGKEILFLPEVNGALIGGASIKEESIIEILKFSSEIEA
jgi:triosephosphate isomerase